MRTRSRALPLLRTLALQQLHEPLLLLSRPPLDPSDQLAPDQPIENLLHRGEVGQRVQALRTLPELADGLSAAEHERAHDRQLRLARDNTEKFIAQYGGAPKLPGKGKIKATTEA